MIPRMVLRSGGVWVSWVRTLAWVAGHAIFPDFFQWRVPTRHIEALHSPAVCSTETPIQQCAESHVPLMPLKQSIGVFHGPKPDSIYRHGGFPSNVRGAMRYRRTVFRMCDTCGRIRYLAMSCTGILSHILRATAGAANWNASASRFFLCSACSCAARAITRRRNAAVV